MRQKPGRRLNPSVIFVDHGGLARHFAVIFIDLQNDLDLHIYRFTDLQIYKNLQDLQNCGDKAR